MHNNSKQFFFFALIGSTGFLVDAGTLTLFLIAGINPILARVPSFLLAATYTWFLNRKVSFRDKSEHLILQWTKFLLANSVGGFVNLSVYTFLVWPDSVLAVPPVTAAAAGALSGLVFNFTLSKKFVFTNNAAEMRSAFLMSDRP